MSLSKLLNTFKPGFFLSVSLHGAETLKAAFRQREGAAAAAALRRQCSAFLSLLQRRSRRRGSGATSDPTASLYRTPQAADIHLV